MKRGILAKSMIIIGLEKTKKTQTQTDLKRWWKEGHWKHNKTFRRHFFCTDLKWTKLKVINDSTEEFKWIQNMDKWFKYWIWTKSVICLNYVEIWLLSPDHQKLFDFLLLLCSDSFKVMWTMRDRMNADTWTIFRTSFANFV